MAKQRKKSSSVTIPNKDVWKFTTDRFVLFFDILGFQDLVLKETHEKIKEILEQLKEYTKISTELRLGLPETHDLENYTIKSFSFSDSIILFSGGNSQGDLRKMLVCGYLITHLAAVDNIPIKGAMSFGKITVDYNNSIFFGQPIIDAFNLHNELQMYCVILDNTCEEMMDIINDDASRSFLEVYDANLKNGRIKHYLIKPPLKKLMEIQHKWTQIKYFSTSGSKRIYIDNTIKFFESISYMDN